MRDRVTPALGAILVALAAAVTAGEDPGPRYGLGETPDPAVITALDIAIGPDGEELPAGRGTVAEGAKLYAAQCAQCHGAGGREGPDPVLVGGRGSLTAESPILTIGSYWPYATTLFDYIGRAMPFMAPGSLSADNVYALCAYLLNANGIIDDDAVMDRVSLPAVHMPNRGGFIPDPRPEFSAAGNP